MDLTMAERTDESAAEGMAVMKADYLVVTTVVMMAASMVGQMVGQMVED